MKKRHFFNLFLLVLFSTSNVYSEENFDTYKNTQVGEYKEYKEDILKEYETYKKVFDEEFKKYKENILKKWEDVKISDKKNWVLYSNDYSIRKSADFENNEIEIDIIVDENTKDEEIKKTFIKEFASFILEDTETAYNKDKLLQSIDKKMKEINSKYVISNIEKIPVLSDVFLNKDSSKEVTYTQNDVKELVNISKENVENGKIKEKKSKLRGKKVVSLNVKMPSDALLKKAKAFKNYVFRYSNREGIDPALVYAIIHTESSFNPMAKSYVPAYGLMQIVPKSAGRDASKKVYGYEKILSPSELYNSRKNIELGVAYINILYYRYLKDVKDRESRYYLTVASYNTGAGNVAKAFVGTTNLSKAIEKINRMSSREVYNTLLKKLPYDETKNYLKKVTKRTDEYEKAISKGEL
ncbi:MAG: rane-bound lytic murein transglycosylase [Fusobacteriaceae bacterium]|nr:rane-bound lytic murein transglycosylase [Fusobacteriales bacterium]MDN5303246.1 rane-bound lytic murein transglycosylase [Fusobacteriaceae bacterium]